MYGPFLNMLYESNTVRYKHSICYMKAIPYAISTLSQQKLPASRCGWLFSVTYLLEDISFSEWYKEIECNTPWCRRLAITSYARCIVIFGGRNPLQMQRLLEGAPPPPPPPIYIITPLLFPECWFGLHFNLIAYVMVTTTFASFQLLTHSRWEIWSLLKAM